MPGSPVDFEQARRQGDDDGTCPLALWPVLLRKREDYYNDWADGVKRELDRIWKSASASMGRADFEDTETAKQLWGPGPLWWGVNDIVGYVELRLDRRRRRVRVTLFETTSRASRTLLKKQFRERASRDVTVTSPADNETLRRDLQEAVEKLTADRTLRKRHLAREEWRATVRHTDWAGLIEELS